MGKKKKGKKGKKDGDAENLPPPEDPLDKLSEQDLAIYKDLFDMGNMDKSGLLNLERVLEIMDEMTDDKVDKDVIEEYMSKHCVKKDENIPEEE